MSSTDHILVIEDNINVAQYIKEISIQSNYKVTIAKSYAECAQLLSQPHQFEVASIDYNLPDAPDGEAIDLVLKNHIPSIVFTGKMDIATREKILTKPIIDYIPKENTRTYDYLGKLLTRLKLNQNIRVLVLESSKSAQLHFINLLERHNFLVLATDNGSEALNILDQYNDIRIVLTDNDLSDIQGVQLTADIRQKYSKDQLTIIGIAGHNNHTLSSQFIQNGANDCIQKPFCNEAFFCRINQNLEHLEVVNRIQSLANIDHLTQLYNRRYFFDKAQDLIHVCKRHNRHYGVAMIDIDHFKQINDKYGHSSGDSVILDIAEQLSRCFSKDLIARFGGEEFCILLTDLSLEKAEHKLEKFRIKVQNSIISADKDIIQYTISIGYANNHTNINPLVSYADNLLYQSKRSGRNKVSVSFAQSKTVAV